MWEQNRDKKTNHLRKKVSKSHKFSLIMFILLILITLLCNMYKIQNIFFVLSIILSKILHSAGVAIRVCLWLKVKIFFKKWNKYSKFRFLVYFNLWALPVLYKIYERHMGAGICQIWHIWPIDRDRTSLRKWENYQNSLIFPMSNLLLL